MTIRIKQEIISSGYVYLPSFLPQKSAEEVAQLLGTVFRTSELAPVQQLTPKLMSEAGPNTYSGIYGIGEFPLHTDLAHWREPPRYLILRCLVGCNAVR